MIILRQRIYAKTVDPTRLIKNMEAVRTYNRANGFPNLPEWDFYLAKSCIERSHQGKRSPDYERIIREGRKILREKSKK